MYSVLVPTLNILAWKFSSETHYIAEWGISTLPVLEYEISQYLKNNQNFYLESKSELGHKKQIVLWLHNWYYYT